MHELSIAQRLVEIAVDHAASAGAQTVQRITIKLGVLSCVHKTALQSGFKWLAAGTLLEGAQLEIIDVPLRIHCPRCDRHLELPGIQSLRCPHCQFPADEVLQGNELEIDTMIITESQ